MFFIFMRVNRTTKVKMVFKCIRIQTNIVFDISKKCGVIFNTQKEYC